MPAALPARTWALLHARQWADFHAWRWARWGSVLVLWLLLHNAPRAHAQVLGPGGLPGGRHVPSALAGEPPHALVGGLEFAHTEPLESGDNAHERLAGTLGAGTAVRRWLALSGELSARYDVHHGGDDSHGALALGTRIATRHGFDLGQRAALALAPAVTFPAADDLSHGFKAASPELSLLGSARLWDAGALSLQGGFRLDRSEHAVDEPLTLKPDDRLAAQLASYDSALLGALLSGRAGKLLWALEWSWDLAVGSGAPAALESPMRVEAVAQTRLASQILLGAHVGASPSSRPSLDGLVRIEPRFWLGVSCGFLFGATQAPRPAPVAQAPVAAAPVVLNQRAVLRVRDASGAPVSGARVESEGEPATITDAEGSASFAGPEGQARTVQITAEGFEPAKAELRFEPDFTLTVTLERPLPAAEIKGSVRSLRGGPLVATIAVVELEKSVQSGADGTFHLEVPPGSYTVRISAPGHESQQRTVRVEQLGVAILVVDLRRSSR